MKMKKSWLIFISVVLMSGLLAGCSAVSAPETKCVTVDGAIFGGQAGDRIQTEISFDDTWITEADNTRYNPDLAAFSALLSTDVYFREKDVERGTENRVTLDGAEEDYTKTALIEAFGFADNAYIESFKIKEYASDQNDSATLLLGHKTVGEAYDVFIVVLRGSFSFGEWSSAFDPGSDTEGYEAYTGAHDEWTDRTCFKGIYIGMSRAKEFIDEFMAEYNDPALPDTVLVTGHSRGAALANMIGAGFEAEGKVKSYTYTFGSMPVTQNFANLNSSDGQYHTVFNVLDQNDFYTKFLPFGEEVFMRNGTDKYLDVAENEKILSELKIRKGREDYNVLSPEDYAVYHTLFAERFPNRASLYEPVSLTETFDTVEEAESRYALLNTLIGQEAGLGLETYVSVSDISGNADGKQEITLNYCSAALLQAYAKVLAYGEPAYEAAAALFSGDEKGTEIADFLIDHIEAITSGHLMINSYVIAKNLR